jgi:arylsulfatase A-like enzyme
MTAISRREFMGAAAAGVALAAGSPAAGRPNILWIVSEDNEPFLGCYGYGLARTPTLDRLAADGVLYENCFSQAPVCAPSRFTLITGMYATSCGPAHHMRAQGKIPAEVRGFPAWLRAAGYYCTNNAKTDYNAPIDAADAWDESGRTAHWRKRPAGRPFFAVFNHEVTHESQLFPENQAKYERLPDPTDPAKVVLPAYHPDLPEFRRDWANYFDQMSRLDTQVGALLKQLEEDGLSEDTIVFYYGDNGGVLPRSKRFPYDSGTHVPLIVRFPRRYRQLAPAGPGARLQAPVSFVDFAPTVLSLAGLEAPGHMQGNAFAGSHSTAPQEFAFSFRSRMDERYDMVRTARDTRYRYMRNYMPHLVYGQHIGYMWQMPSVAAWERAFRAGRLNAAQRAFWEDKPFEELYDLRNDPHEVRNLSGSPAHRDLLGRMRAALDSHLLSIRDNGFIPEGSELEGYVETRNSSKYPLERILSVAGAVSRRDAAQLPNIRKWLADPDECVRYWASLGCVMLRADAAPAAQELRARLRDASGSVRVAAAEALCRIGAVDAGLPELRALLGRHPHPRIRLQAANALQTLGPVARPALPEFEAAAAGTDEYLKRAGQYFVESAGASK